MKKYLIQMIEIMVVQDKLMDQILVAEEIAFHNQPYSIKIKVPPMATINKI